MSEQSIRPVCYRHSDRPTYLSCSECGRPICADCSHDAPVGQRCPECARPTGRHRVVRARDVRAGPSFRTSPVTFTLIAVDVTIWVLGQLYPTLGSELFQRFAEYGPLVRDGEWWRVITAAFLHGGILHIFFNMYFLYLFGPRLEQQVGSTSFSAIYVASAVGGSVASLLFGPPVPSIGASGALFGLFGAWLYAAYRQRGSAAGRRLFNELGGLLLLNLALPFFIPNIDLRAHIGGLATGLFITFLWEKVALKRPNAAHLRTYLALAVLAALSVIVLLI